MSLCILLLLPVKIKMSCSYQGYEIYILDCTAPSRSWAASLHPAMFRHSPIWLKAVSQVVGDGTQKGWASLVGADACLHIPGALGLFPCTLAKEVCSGCRCCWGGAYLFGGLWSSFCSQQSPLLSKMQPISACIRPTGTCTLAFSWSNKLFSIMFAGGNAKGKRISKRRGAARCCARCCTNTQWCKSCARDPERPLHIVPRRDAQPTKASYTAEMVTQSHWSAPLPFLPSTLSKHQWALLVLTDLPPPCRAPLDPWLYTCWSQVSISGS